MPDYSVDLTGATSAFGIYGYGNNRVVFQNPRGNKNYYVFYRSTLPTATLYYEWSSDGKIWTNTQGTVAGSVTHFDVKIHDTGSLLEVYLVWTESATEDLTYRYGTISDSSDTISWSTPQDIDAALVSEIDSNFACAIARTDNGRLVVAFTEDVKVTGKAYRQTKIIGADGCGASPSWSNETTIDDPSGSTNNKDKGNIFMGMEAFSSSYPNRVFIYGHIPDSTVTTTYDIKTWTYDWNGSSMSSVDSATTGVLTASISFLTGVIDDSDYVHLGRGYGTSTKSWKGSSAGSATLDSSIALTSTNPDCGTFTIDRTNDRLYAYYHHSADAATLHWKETPVGTISWGSEQSVTLQDTPTVLSSHNSDVEGGLRVAFVDDDQDIFVYHGVESVVTITDSRIANDTGTWQAACNIDITGWDKSNDFVLACYCYDGHGTSQTFKLQFFRSGISWTDVGVGTEIAQGYATHIVDGDPIGSAAGCQTAGQGVENEGDNSASVTPKLDTYTEFQFALDPTFANDSTEYSFRLVNNETGVLGSTLAVTLTTSSGATVGYKDITLKTSIESNLTYKDITLKTSLESQPTFKDITLKTSLESNLTFKDITLKTSLESNLTYKDIALKTSLHSLNYKDVSLKTSIWGTVYKDIALKTSIESNLTYKDITVKTSLESNLTYKDITLKTSLHSLGYKDVVLKTSLESALTFKDVSLKTSLTAAPTFKDVNIKTSLDSALTYKDVVIKTSLESILIYKDVSLKTSLQSLDYKDVVLKTSLQSLDYKDITLKTSLHSLDYKDIVLKVSLDSAPSYKDITLKTSLESNLTYKDVVLKTSLHSLNYKDVTLKTSLLNKGYKDVAIKTSLELGEIVGYKDISLKTSLESNIIYKDVVLKTSLHSLDYKDITLKTSLHSLEHKDVTLKTSLDSALTYKDITLKTSIISNLTYKDITLKTSLESANTYKDIVLKTTLESVPIYKDVNIKTSLHSLDYKDVTIKTSIESGLTYKDVTIKSSLESVPTYKDVTIKTSLESSAIYKDVVLKSSLESALTYKDVAIKASLQLEQVIGYKDITLKVSLFHINYKDIVIKVSLEAIPKEIINFTSTITQVNNFTSSITQTKNFTSTITQTVEFESDINS